MAVNPVNLCADLQAWHSAGLSFLLFPDVEARELLRARPMPTAGRSATAAARVVASSAENRSGGFERANQTNPAASQAQEHKGAAGAQAGSGTISGGSATASSVSERVDGSASLSNVPPRVAEAGRKAASAVLPEAWEGLGARLKPAPVVWTYLELGEDLLVQGNPERSGLLKELIASLGLKRGTSTFLPVILPGRDCEGGEAWCFQAMLNRLGGRILVVMGEDALQRSPYAELGLGCFQEKIVQGRMLLRLPSFTELLADPARFEATRVFLRSAFSKINIL